MVAEVTTGTLLEDVTFTVKVGELGLMLAAASVANASKTCVPTGQLAALYVHVPLALTGRRPPTAPARTPEVELSIQSCTVLFGSAVPLNVKLPPTTVAPPAIAVPGVMPVMTGG